MLAELIILGCIIQIPTETPEPPEPIQVVASAESEVDEVTIVELPEEPKINPPQEQHITKQSGVFSGPSGKETYYNLNMTGMVNIMRSLGYDAKTYPYWVREDGCKMLGDYVMVAADFNTRPRGTILETSMGTAIVCDTGGFVAYNPTQIDIAVNW